MDRRQLTRNKVSARARARPVATAVGAAAGGAAGGVIGGAAAGAVAGGITGPVGATVGAVVGALAGGMAGRDADKVLNPVAEETYWRENYALRPYVERGTRFDDYAPAYRYGLDAYTRYPGRGFDEIDADLARDWSVARGSSGLAWERARHAVRDAWQRVSDTVERATPGDSDRDGK